jgi:hypothetical protein
MNPLQGGATPQGGVLSPGAMLQGAAQGAAQGATTPTPIQGLSDNAQALYNIAQSHPIGNPNRYKFLNMAMQLSQPNAQQAQAQGANPTVVPQAPSAQSAQQPGQQAQPTQPQTPQVDPTLIVTGKDGVNYSFPNIQAANVFRQQEGIPIPPAPPQKGGFLNDLLDTGKGLVKGIGQVGEDVSNATLRPLSNAILGNDTQPTHLNALDPTDTAEKIGKGIGESVPLVAGAIAAPASIPADLGLAGSIGAGGIADATINEVQGKSPVSGAIAGAAGPLADEVLAPVTNAIKGGLGNLYSTIAEKAPLLTRGTETAAASTGSAPENAVAAYKDAFSSVSTYRKAIGQQFSDAAEALTQALPDKTIDITPQMGKLINVANEYGLNLEDVIPTTADGRPIPQLNPSQTQDLLTELNRQWKVPAVSDVTDAIRQSARETFGQPFDDIYSSFSNQVNGISTLRDIFNIKNPNLTSSDIQAGMDKIANLSSTPNGRVILKNTLDDFKNISGIDLTDKVKATQAVSKLQHPAAKAAGKLLLKALGLGVFGDIVKHI